MSKTITISSISVKELTIDEAGGGWRLTVLYEWVNSVGEKVSQKRITIYPPGSGPLPEMPPAAQTRLNDLMTALANFIQQQDGI